MPEVRLEGSSTVGELSSMPLSQELLQYYRARLEASEAEMRGLEARIDATAASQAEQHKARWETLKRMDEITDLQKALSDSHVFLWEEREKNQRLQAENDELRVQELEDRRKIQHLLSLVDPLVQDTTYVDSLLLTVESLRAQLQQQEQLGRERVAALLEDRRLRVAEERARRAAESDRAQEADATLERTQQMLHQYTKDYLALKHSSLVEARAAAEALASARSEAAAASEALSKLQSKTELELHAVHASARSGAEQYVSLYRQQVTDSERTMGLLKDQHHGLQQALAMRIKELEAVVGKLRHGYKQLDARRHLELEGFTHEIGGLRKQVRRLELKAFGRKAIAEHDENEPPPAGARAAGAKVAHGARALRAMQARVQALEKSLVGFDEALE